MERFLMNLSRLVPFIVFGVFLVLFAVGIYLMVYLLIAGALVGLIMFAFSWIKEKLFPSKNLTSRQKENTRSGRTIDHDDL
jgi:hypothetical protein